MIKSFIFDNFKSFKHAELNIESSSTMIGMNSSGKSNAIEGIKILSSLADGYGIADILDGGKCKGSAIRGGSTYCVRKKARKFRLGCVMKYSEKADYRYEIEINVQSAGDPPSLF